MGSAEKVQTFNLLIQDGIPLLKINRDSIDLTSAQELSRLLSEAESKGHGILVDFSKLTYIDSVIISTIVKHFVDNRKMGHRLVLFGTGKLVESLLKTTRLNTVLDLAENIEAAVEMCRQPLEQSEMKLYSREEGTDF